MTGRRSRLLIGGAVGVAAAAVFFATLHGRPDAAEPSPLNNSAPNTTDRDASATSREAATQKPAEIAREPFVDQDSATPNPLDSIPDGACRFRFRVVYDDGAPLARCKVEVGTNDDDPNPSPVWYAIASSRLAAELDEEGVGEVVAPINAPAIVSSNQSYGRYPDFEVATRINPEGTTEIVVPTIRRFTLTIVDENGLPGSNLNICAESDGERADTTNLTTDRDGRLVLRGYSGSRLTFGRWTDLSGDFVGFAFSGASDGATFVPEKQEIVADVGASSARVFIRRDQGIRGRWVSPDILSKRTLQTRAYVEVEGHDARAELPVQDGEDGRFVAAVIRDGYNFALDARLTRIVVEAWRDGGEPLATTTLATSASSAVDLGDIPVERRIPIMRLRFVDENDLVASASPIRWRFPKGADTAADAAPSIDEPGICRVVVPDDASELVVGGEEFAETVVPRPKSLDQVVVVKMERRARLDVRVEDAAGRALVCQLIPADPGDPKDNRAGRFAKPQSMDSGRATLRPGRHGVAMTLVVGEAPVRNDVAHAPYPLSATEVAPFAAGEFRELTIKVPRLGRGDIVGRLARSDGTPIANGSIMLEIERAVPGFGRCAPHRFQQISGADGTFVYSNVPHGRAALEYADKLFIATAAFDFNSARREIEIVIPAPWIARAEIRGVDSVVDWNEFCVRVSIAGGPEWLKIPLWMEREGGSTRTVEIEAPQGAVVRFVASRHGVRFEGEARENGPTPQIDVSGAGAVVFETSKTTAETTAFFDCRRIGPDGAYGPPESRSFSYYPAVRRINTTLLPGRYVLEDPDRAPIFFEVRARETTHVTLPR